jgi:8-oxo-dGTP pyrophosphatase MutT (NUDIX family)
MIKRHYTSSGLIVKNNSVLLHYHLKIKLWLPPGGHIEENEDPIQALKREVLEETGLLIDIINTSSTVAKKFQNVYSLTPPHTIFIESISDKTEGNHEHIDFIYICKIVGGQIKNNKWKWFTKKDIFNRSDQRYNFSSDITLTDELIDLCLETFKLV